VALMPYRDRRHTCPRCRVALDRDPRERERWRCSACAGELLAVDELVDDLLALAPDLRPSGGIRDVTTRSRGRATPLPCAVCDDDMEPVFLGAVEIDRCRKDALVWFDLRELERVLARATEQHHERQAGLLRRVIAYLRG
jgi:Zn-finger nucleic acid-binding protein